MNVPFLKERVQALNVEAALKHIHQESARLLEQSEKAKRAGGDAEIQFIVDMSGFEAYMTNFCSDFRAKFV